MKVKFSCPVKGLSGKKDELVFCYYKKSGVVIAREFVEQEITEHNHTIGSQAKNLSQFYHSVSTGYFEDLMSYADRYNLETIGNSSNYNGFTVLTKMMYSLKKNDPTVNLLTITPTDVVVNNLPITTIREAIDTGLLIPVARYAEFTNSIL